MTIVEQVRGWFAQHRHEQARASAIAGSLQLGPTDVVDAMDEMLRNGELVGARVTRGDGTKDIDARLALSRSGLVPPPAFNGPVVTNRVIVPRTTLGDLAAPAGIDGGQRLPVAPVSAPTPKQQSALDVLRTEGPLLVPEVAKALGATESATAYLLRQLELKGLAQSAPAAGNRLQWRAVGADGAPPAAAARAIPRPALQPGPAAASMPSLDPDEAMRRIEEAMRQQEEEGRCSLAHVDPDAPALSAVLGSNGALQLRRGAKEFSVLPQEVADLYRIACAARVLTEGLA